MKKRDNVYPNWYAIASQSINGVIGDGKYMPWNVPDDLQWFRTKTNGENVLMGRKTFETIKVKNPKCKYWILTRNPDLSINTENVIYCNNLEVIKKQCCHETMWIAGGEKIYSQLLNNCSGLYLSTIKGEYKGDHYFPNYLQNFVFKERLHEDENFKIEYFTNKELTNDR